MLPGGFAFVEYFGHMTAVADVTSGDALLRRGEHDVAAFGAVTVPGDVGNDGSGDGFGVLSAVGDDDAQRTACESQSFERGKDESFAFVEGTAKPVFELLCWFHSE